MNNKKTIPLKILSLKLILWHYHADNHNNIRENLVRELPKKKGMDKTPLQKYNQWRDKNL